MRKLKLHVEQLQVTTFTLDAAPRASGTVDAHGIIPPQYTNEYQTCMQTRYVEYASCALSCQQLSCETACNTGPTASEVTMVTCPNLCD